MTKLTSVLLNDLRVATTNMSRRIVHREQCPITADQLLIMALGEKDFDVLKQAGRVLNSPHGDMVYTVGITGFTRGDVPGLVTTSPRLYLVIRPGPESTRLVPEELDISRATGGPEYEALLEWLRWRLGVGAKFTAILLLAEAFAAKGLGLEHLRYVLPGVLGLCRSHEPLGRYVERLEDFRAPRTTPSLPPGVRTLCRDIGETLATAAMFEHQNQPQIGIGGVGVGPTLGSVRIAELAAHTYSADIL